MTILTKTALGAATLLLATPEFGSGAGFFCDPVVTHTNGMRLASSTSTRSHNAYWQCDKGHVGYCDGLMRGHCYDDARSLGTRCHGRFVPPYTPMGPTSNQTAYSVDGLETASGESLGMIVTGSRTLPAGLGGRAAAAAANAQSPPGDAPQAGGVWLDAIQTIGKKMMATPSPEG